MEETKPAPHQEIPSEFIETLVNAVTDRAKRDKRSDATYANNVRFEPSVWDLKLIFGQLDQSSGKSKVDWHTGVTIPWMQAKILNYYLSVNLVYEEFYNGSISIHSNVRPAKPEPPNDPTNATAQAIHEIITKIHAETFGE